MSRWFPSVEEERQIAVRRRAEKWVAEGSISKEQRLAIEAAQPLAWKTFGVLAFAALLFLSAQAIGTAYWFNESILPFGELITAIGCIALAERLIVKKRWWSTGVEQALWLGGLFSLILSLPGEGKPEAILLFAAAAAIAGFRLRSAFLGTIGALLAVVYLAVKSWDSRAVAETCSVVAIAVAVLTAIVATAALRREWKRPSTELLWTFVIVTVPPAALFASQLWDERYLFAFIAGALGTFLAIAGLRMRHHAPLLSAILFFAAAGARVVESKFLATEAMLAIFGATLLAGAFVVSRALRGRTGGIVVTPSKLTVVDDAVETAAVFTAGPQQTDAPPDQQTGGGGSFGGAGATGQY